MPNRAEIERLKKRLRAPRSPKMNGVEIKDKQRVEVKRDWVIAIAGGIRYLGRPVDVRGAEEKADEKGSYPELILSPIYEIMRNMSPQTGQLGVICVPAELMTGEGLRGLLLHADVIFSLESAHERDIRAWQEQVDHAERIRLDKILHMAKLVSATPARRVSVEDKA